MASPREILKKYWGYDGFRPLQEEIIQSVMQGKDTLALLPTGGGKSICFQVPGVLKEGLCLVVSPLIALMKDQVEHLNRRGIPATYINSSLSRKVIDQKLQQAMDGEFRFLYLAPERLKTEMFLQRLDRMPVTLLAIDEAHCISQWGYDFRPSYLKIKELRTLLPDIPVIALTASATPEVKQDILEQLDMADAVTFQKSFRRPNLSYRVEETDNVAGRIIYLCQQLEGAGIVYARTRKSVIRMAEALQKAGIRAKAYHGGMKSEDRDKIQSSWIDNETRIITATNAFGMGIDKPDVRFVLHLNLPSDLESYYQEAGRGGRDGEYALALSFKNGRDIDEVTRWVKEKYPDWDTLNYHYEVLCNFFGIPNTGVTDTIFTLDIGKICKTFKVPILPLFNSINLLDKEGILSFSELPDQYGYLRVLFPPREVLVYKERYPQSADLIDFILRDLGGEVFSEEMRFSPGFWAWRLKMDPGLLQKQLLHFAERGMLSFRTPESKPSLRFNTPRHRLTKLELNWEKYSFLLELSEKRLASMLRYVETPAHGCRSLQIEQYFGEKGRQNCGYCDYCIDKNNKKGGSQQEMREEILQLLQNGPLFFGALVQSLSGESRKNKEEVIRQMLDRKLILSDENGILRLK